MINAVITSSRNVNAKMFIPGIKKTSAICNVEGWNSSNVNYKVGETENFHISSPGDNYTDNCINMPLLILSMILYPLIRHKLF